MNQWADERVEAFIDGDLPDEELARLSDLLAVGLAEEDVRLARRVRSGLRKLPQPRPSPALAERVLRHAREDVRRSRLAALRELFWLDALPALRPALTMAFLALVVVSAALVGRTAQTREEISQAEVRQALAEAKWALAKISEAGRKTGATVREDVLESHVVEPVRTALGAALDANPDTDLK